MADVDVPEWVFLKTKQKGKWQQNIGLVVVNFGLRIRPTENHRAIQPHH